MAMPMVTVVVVVTGGMMLPIDLLLQMGMGPIVVTIDPPTTTTLLLSTHPMTIGLPHLITTTTGIGPPHRTRTPITIIVDTPHTTRTPLAHRMIMTHTTTTTHRIHHHTATIHPMTTVHLPQIIMTVGHHHHHIITMEVVVVTHPHHLSRTPNPHNSQPAPL